MAQEQMKEKVTRLRRIVRDFGSVIVAFSGGVDSALVAVVAHQELGERALAVTGRSPSLAEGEIDAAEEVARGVGMRHEIIETREFDNPAYRANPADRCFFCKDELYERLVALARARGFAIVADGSNADDGRAALDIRPGRRAAREHGVRSPLAQASLTKADVRAAAHALGLRVWDKPAAPCLSSRVPYGTQIELDDLRRIDLAERYLRARGFSDVRVRHYGATARVEVAKHQVARIHQEREALAHALRAVGYARLEIDPRGYRTGSLNESRLA